MKRLLPLLLVAASLHASEPATRSSNSFNAQSILGIERLDEPVDMRKNFQLDKGVLELRGPIDSAMRTRFESMVAAGGVTTVRITSQGGQIIDAVQMGILIEARHIDVVVRDFCLGACAQYLFVAGRKRKLEDQALVGFMNTIKSSAMLLKMATDTLEVQNTIESLMGRFAGLEEELYRRRGIDDALLVDPQIAAQPACVILKREGRAFSWNTTSRYLMWVPTRDYLKKMGVEFEGGWPLTRFWLGGMANRHMKLRIVSRVRFGDDDHLRDQSVPPYSLQDVRKCVFDEEPTPAGAPG